MYYFTPNADQENTHDVTRILLRLMGAEEYDKWARHTWAITTTWEERHELAAAKLAELVIDRDEFACVTDTQSCPACRKAATAELEQDEIPY